MKEKMNLNHRVKHFLAGMLFLQSMFISQEMIAREDTFPYELKKMDIALLPLGLTIQILGENWVDNKGIMSEERIALLNRDDVNAFDRPATCIFSGSADNISDRIRTSLVMIPGLMIGHQLLKKEWRHALTYGVMYYEAYLFTQGITALIKASTGRIRPYLYNDELSIAERYEYTKTRDSYGSFFSGHTSAMFAAAVMLSKTFTDIYGKSKWSKLVWATTLTAASIGGYCRYASGEHYPTDVIAGAMFGAAIGYIIPVLHKSSNENIGFSVKPGSFYFSYRF